MILITYCFITITLGPHLIVITERNRVGDINGETIWKVTKLEVLSFRRTVYHLNEEQVCIKYTRS